MAFWNKKKPESGQGTVYKMLVEKGNGQYAWNGKLYESDIVRACIRPKVRAIGKLVGKQIRETEKNGKTVLKVNPDPSIRFLLEDPNPYMSGQKLLEKMAVQLELNNNAFAVILRDENGMAIQLYPITATAYEAIYDEAGELFIRFWMANGRPFIFAYKDLIHLRQDYNQNDIFGTPIADVLTPLMQVIRSTDRSIVNAIQNSSAIRWLLKYNTSARPEDMQLAAKNFANAFLTIENGTGVAAVDSKVETEQIKPNDFVPNAEQMSLAKIRVYELFGTNEKIVQSNYNEDEWLAYFEAQIEPVAVELHNEFTRKIFSRRERAAGNRIVFEASDLKFASLKTILEFREMVDRGAMLPNEWRKYLNLAPVPGGDKPIRRLDTATVQEGGEPENGDQD